MRQQHLLAALLVLAHFVLSAAFSVVNPLGEAPDEADHFAYVVYLAEEQALPVGPRVTQSKHPPLYHAGAAAIAGLATPDHRFLRANPDVELSPRPGWSPNFFIHSAEEAWPWADNGARGFHLARFWSVLLSTLTVAGAYGLTLTAFPAHALLSLTATGVLAFLPGFAFIGGSVNNDNAAALFGTLGLWAGLLFWRRGGDLRAAWWAPLALGAGLLSKTSTLGVWPAVGVAILLGACASPTPPGTMRAWWHALWRNWTRWLASGLYVFGGALLVASPWLLRNLRLYGDPLGMALTRQTIDLRSTPWTWADTSWLLTGWFRSFWGKFGGAGHIPMAEPVYLLLLLLTVISTLGLLGNLWPARRRYARTPILLLTLAAIGVAAGIVRYSLVALGTDQGRLLYPALTALVVLWSTGLLWWSPPRVAHVVGGALVGGTAALAVYALLGVVRPAFAPPTSPDADILETIRTEEAVVIDDLALIGWTLDEEPTLYWEARVAPTRDYRVVLRVVAEDGSLVWERTRSPGGGRWSTDRWPADAVVADRYEIDWPDWAGSGRYLVEAGVRPFDGELLTDEEGRTLTPLGAIER